MDPIFLVPEATVSVSIKPEYSGEILAGFTVEDGGPYEIRTATGREYGKIQKAFRDDDVDSLYELLPDFLLKGVGKKEMENLHPFVVRAVLWDVIKRSRVSEAEAGK